MEKIFLWSILSLFLCSGNRSNEIKNCFQLKYDTYNISGTDTVKDIKTIWIFQHYIYEFNKNPSENSIYNFDKEMHTLRYLDREHIFITDSIQRNRKFAYLIRNRNFEFASNFEVSIPTISSENPSTGQITSEITDTIYFDNSIKIPKSKYSGFLDYIDNGLGYLPVRFERTLIDLIKGEKKKIIFNLINRDSILLESKQIAEVFK